MEVNYIIAICNALLFTLSIYIGKIWIFSFNKKKFPMKSLD